MVSNSKEKAATPPVSAKKGDTIGIIKFLKGGDGKFKCRSKIIKIGKHRDSDVVVKGFGVGRTSATISRGPDGFCLTFVGGMSRPRVNGEKVKRERILADADVIKIGAAELQFFERKPRKPGNKNPEKTTQTAPQPSPE
jgi:pSer/pThr/pTyr-binding forkhead associated (FHA) protein